ncbi:MAG TPA: heme-binding protein [Candidatus Nanoarchaeia archaeon]|nr:heme-binding protein [Candidatus Nanoarchaeia archaeon]
MRVIHSLSYAQARVIVDDVLSTASKGEGPVAVAVTDPFGNLIAFAAMDGCPVDSLQLAINKAYTSARRGKPTLELEDRVKTEPTYPTMAQHDSKLCFWGGGVPVTDADTGKIVLGGIGVSGRKSHIVGPDGGDESLLQDHELAAVAAEASNWPDAK